LVEKQNFIKFGAILNPHFKLTNNALINSIFRHFISERKDLIQYFKRRSIGMVSATTDFWTSGNNLAMMAVTVTWLTFDFVMMEVTLGFRELMGDHSGVNIANCFLSILNEFGLQNRVSITIFTVFYWTTHYDYFVKIRWSYQFFIFLAKPLFFSFNLQLLCVTTENASSNGTFIEELTRLTKNFDCPFEKENWIKINQIPSKFSFFLN
jgi:hypothetical protein